MQTTIKSSVSFAGIGLHTGRLTRVTVCPAAAEYGIWFKRTDVQNADPLVHARWHSVDNTLLNTRIANDDGVSVSTIEHLMAALAGCGIHNAIVQIDGDEVPLLDGSSAEFVKGIMSKGVRRLDAPLYALRILKTVEVKQGDAWARVEPADHLTIDFEIDFADRAIGRQVKSLNMANGSFVRELSRSRTFCRQADVDMMRERGLIAGGSVTSAVVVDGENVLTPGGLRHADEPVRHKMLDALGDLSLAGAPVLGRYVGHRAGHGVTNTLLRAVFADPEAFEFVECDEAMLSKLPGSGLTDEDLLVYAA